MDSLATANHVENSRATLTVVVAFEYKKFWQKVVSVWGVWTGGRCWNAQPFKAMH